MGGRAKWAMRINGLPVVVRLLRALRRHVDQFILVTSDESLAAAREMLSGWNLALVLQKEPLGDGHAVLQAQELAREFDASLVVWSDVVLLDDLVVNEVLEQHRAAPESDLTILTACSERPYVEIVLDEAGIPSGFRHPRLGQAPEGRGETDCGLFVGRSRPLFQALERCPWRSTGRPRQSRSGGARREQFFLDVIALFRLMGLGVRTASIGREQRIMSFNSPAEFRRIEEVIRGRNGRIGA